MPLGELLAQITGEPSPKPTTFPSLPKRKADDDLRRPTNSTQRVGTQLANSSRPIIQPRRPAAIDTTKGTPNGGSLSNSAPTTATLKNGHPTPPPSTDPPKVPKKGSYAEIMARAKAAQSTLGQVGKIQHKQIEKQPSRREWEAMKAKKGKSIQNGLSSNSKFQRTGKTPGAAKDGPKRAGKVTAEPEKKVKKAALATTGYAGTARPKPGGASSKSGTGSSSRTERDRFKKDRLGSRYDRYLSEDEEDEELEDDLEQDYESDVSSDMEAAVFEVDEEEELASKIARREDAAALAEETRLKKEKEEKKRRLMAMAKKAGARR